MSIDDKIRDLEDRKEREKHVSDKWPDRFGRLVNQGLTRDSFCRYNNIDNTYICHILAGRRIPSQEFIDRVDVALTKAGV